MALTRRLTRQALTIRLQGRSPIIAVAEVRYSGWTYRAEMHEEAVGTYNGASNLTTYFRYNGGWRPITWDAVPTPAYRALRRELRKQLAYPIE